MEENTESAFMYDETNSVDEKTSFVWETGRTQNNPTGRDNCFRGIESVNYFSLSICKYSYDDLTKDWIKQEGGVALVPGRFCKKVCDLYLFLKVEIPAQKWSSSLQWIREINSAHQ